MEDDDLRDDPGHRIQHIHLEVDVMQGDYLFVGMARYADPETRRFHSFRHISTVDVESAAVGAERAARLDMVRRFGIENLRDLGDL